MAFTTIKAQKVDYGAFIGINTNILSLRSDYKIQNGINAKPTISYDFGSFIKTNKNRINLLGSLEYLRIKNQLEPDLSMNDNVGNNLMNSKSSIINHNLLISAIGTIRIVNRLYLGVGISGSVLIKSTFKLKDKFSTNDGQKLEKHYNIKYYHRFVISLPVTIGYNFERINIFARFNKGLMNRIKGESYIKEIDNTFILGIGYKLR